MVVVGPSPSRKEVVLVAVETMTSGSSAVVVVAAAAAANKRIATVTGQKIGVRTSIQGSTMKKR